VFSFISCYPRIGSMKLHPRHLCRPCCTLAAWPFFYETDTSIHKVSLEKMFEHKYPCYGDDSWTLLSGYPIILLPPWLPSRLLRGAHCLYFVSTLHCISSSCSQSIPRRREDLRVQHCCRCHLRRGHVARENAKPPHGGIWEDLDEAVVRVHCP
jgi:hypothetical protein